MKRHSNKTSELPALEVNAMVAGKERVSKNKQGGPTSVVGRITESMPKEQLPV